MKPINFFSVLFLLVLSSSVLATKPLEPEDYLKVFTSGTNIEKRKAAESLAWSGISSPKLYDIIEKHILENYKTRNYKEKRFIGQLIRSLGYSGNEKYRSTLRSIKKDIKKEKKKLRRSIDIALKSLKSYQVYNSIIAPKGWPEFEHPNQYQRLSNMITSDHFPLIKTAAKQITKADNQTPETLNATETTVKKLAYSKFDRNDSDAIAWACRALATSQSPKYKKLLEDIGKKSKNSQVRQKAKWYVEQYY